MRTRKLSASANAEEGGAFLLVACDIVSYKLAIADGGASTGPRASDDGASLCRSQPASQLQQSPLQ